MKNFNFSWDSPIQPLYISHVLSTTFIHSIRKNGERSPLIEPYTPSMFIYAFFTFNSIYNCDWLETEKNGFGKLAQYSSGQYETTKIESLITYIFNKADCKSLSASLRESLLEVMSKYNPDLSSDNPTKLYEWVKRMMEDFEYESSPTNEQGYDFYRGTIDYFKNTLNNILHSQIIELNDFIKLAIVIYHIRCNLFHGAKDPQNFEANHQMERFVIYSAILIGFNQVLFSIAFREIHFPKTSKA